MNKRIINNSYSIYLFPKRHSGKHFVSNRHKHQLKLASDGQWTEVTSRQWEKTVAARSALTYFMVRGRDGQFESSLMDGLYYGRGQNEG